MTNKLKRYLLKLKNKKLSKYKKTAPLFLYFEVHMHLNLSFLFIFLCYTFVETLFNIDLCTHVTKNTVILNFNFSHTIFPQWRRMPY